jgi:hypothetical protein
MVFFEIESTLYVCASSNHDSVTPASQATGISGVPQCQHCRLHVMLQLFIASCHSSVLWHPAYCAVQFAFFEQSWNSAYIQTDLHKVELPEV